MAITETLPKMGWTIEVPTRPEEMAKRTHNKIAKDAMRETAHRWHTHSQGFVRHFQRDARQRYNHFPRTEKYKRGKARGLKIDGQRYYSTIDLIKTGASKQQMLSEGKITAGGSAAGGDLRATLTVRFAFKGGSGRFRKKSKKALENALTVARMRLELSRFHEDDVKLIAKWFLELYMKNFNAVRSGRKRKSFGRKAA